MSPLIRLLLILCLWPLTPVRASILCNEACTVFQKEGNLLYSMGKYQEAIEKFKLADKADPTASIPVSSIAQVLLQVAGNASPEHAAAYRQQAEAAAHEALRRASGDPLASEVLRQLLDAKPPPLHQPSQQTGSIVQAGEILFQRAQYAEALDKFEAAAASDPQYSGAWVLAGDCFYVQGKWAEAETRFRKAAELEPLNGQAWRFLSDALAQQRRLSEADVALLNGIAAQPSQIPNWDKLAALRAATSLPLKRLNLVRTASGRIDPTTGKPTITIDANVAAQSKPPDYGFWLVYAMSSVANPSATPFQSELDAWRRAFATTDEVAAKTDKALSNPALLALQKVVLENQLEAAILLLMYRESFRPEFEAWKAAHPQGIKTFIERYGLRP